MTTTSDPRDRDGSGRVGEIALMTDRDAIIEDTPTKAMSTGRGSRIAATTMTKKLRGINRSSGGSRSPDTVRHWRRF